MSIKNTKHSAQSIYLIKYVTCARVLQDLNTKVVRKWKTKKVSPEIHSYF